MSDGAVILSSVRLPTGRFLGALKDLTAPALGALVIREAVRRASRRELRLFDRRAMTGLGNPTTAPLCPSDVRSESRGASADAARAVPHRAGLDGGAEGEARHPEPMRPRRLCA